MRRLDRADRTLIAIYSSFAFAAVTLALTCSFKKKEVKPEEHQPSAEDASFMLECVYEFSLEPAQCREILEGGDPPDSPWKDGC